MISITACKNFLIQIHHCFLWLRLQLGTSSSIKNHYKLAGVAQHLYNKFPRECGSGTVQEIVLLSPRGAWTAKILQYQCFCTQNYIRNLSRKATPRIQIPLNFFFNEMKGGSSKARPRAPRLGGVHTHLRKDQLLCAAVRETGSASAPH